MMQIKFGVIVLPGSNCDHDAYHAARHVCGQQARFIWHKEESVGDSDVVIIPGGFSYGDYLRSGAIARFSPIMKDVVRFARDGGLVIGICNGFQVLCEAGLLPGALMRNDTLKFGCRKVNLRVENASTPFTSGYNEGDVVEMSIAHGEGNYFADQPTLDALRDRDGIIFRYSDRRGTCSPEANPNGSVENIAGIVNERGNVLGMMPHPERSVEVLLGGTDGKRMFDSVIEHFVAQPA